MEHHDRLTHLSNRQRTNPAHVTFCVQAVLSPLLANIYLNKLDRIWAARCGQLGVLVRYADDLVALCGTESQAREALRRIGLVMNRLGLTLHPAKTRLVDLRRGKESFVFLGCTCTVNHEQPRLALSV